MPFTLPDLPFAYDALQPHFDARTMEIHHNKHHAGYIKKANAALAGTQWADASACDILRDLDSLPADLRSAARKHVGGHCNHSFFWSILSPQGGGTPTGTLASAIDSTFGSFTDFQSQFAAAAAGRFGSGWVWLALKDGQLSIIHTEYQDSPLTAGYTRVLGLDVWEHAYYLHYQNRRGDYVTAFWNVVNWAQCQTYFDQGGI